MATMQQQRGRGRPRTIANTTAKPIYTSESTMSSWARELRATFDSLTPAQQRETRERVELILESQRAVYLHQRGTPSQLAQLAYRVYGIWVDWLPAHWQVERDSFGLQGDQFDKVLRAIVGEQS